MTSSPWPPETPRREDAPLSRRGDDLAARLAARFGDDRVSTTGLADRAPDGCTPRALLTPASAAEAAAILAYARAEGLRVAPVGGGTRRSAGGLPQGLDLLLSTARLNRILEYTPADFVITAEAGVTLESLRAVTAPEGQWLALDPPTRAPSTLGGALSVDASGPHRYLYGTARDLVVGLEAALTSGDVVRSGGRVVKNVAGYDLKKIFLGALGTLGVITSVSIKLHAIPEEESLIVASFPDYVCAAGASAALLQAGYEIATLDLLNRETLEALDPAAIPDKTGCGLLLSLTGTPASNEAQASEVATLCAQSGSLSTRARKGEAATAIWRRLQDLCAPPAAAGEAQRVTVRIAVPIRETAAMAARAESILAGAGALRLVARSGNGILNLYLDRAPQEMPVEALHTLRADAIAKGGSLVLEEAPPALKARLDVWGQPAPALALHRKIKQAFDPAGTLAPGRFVGGL